MNVFLLGGSANVTVETAYGLGGLTLSEDLQKVVVAFKKKWLVRATKLTQKPEALNTPLGRVQKVGASTR
jgi:hypothetical protein